MRWWVLAVLTACYSPSPLDSHCARCSGTVECLRGDTCIDGLCQQSAGQCDGELDAGIDGEVRTCFGVELRPFHEMCLPAGVMVPPMASFGVTVDTDVSCTYVDPASPARQKPELCVIAADTITISADVRFVGNRPVVLLARNQFRIMNNATVDVAGHSTDPAALSAAGANVPGCAAPSGTNGSMPSTAGGGAPGGSFQARGGDGSFNGAGSFRPSLSEITSPGLRGGCRGGLGGSDPGGVTGGGHGGPSGGAIYVLAPSISVDGTINASGGGARTEAALRAGGGGGGSGGMILLWAVQPINVTSAARIFALGGGGGSGGTTAMIGQPGDDPDGPTSPATSTPTSGGPGAGGGSTQDVGKPGTQGATGNGGGGGGGSAGYIKTIPMASGSQFAPPPS